jgi:hypothetical protein
MPLGCFLPLLVPASIKSPHYQRLRCAYEIAEDVIINAEPGTRKGDLQLAVAAKIAEWLDIISLTVLELCIKFGWKVSVDDDDLFNYDEWKQCLVNYFRAALAFAMNIVWSFMGNPGMIIDFFKYVDRIGLC